MIANINLLPKKDQESKLFSILVASMLVIWLAVVSYQIYLYIQERQIIQTNEERINSYENTKTDLQAKLANIQAQETQTKMNTLDPVAMIRMIYEKRIDAGMILDQLNALLANSGEITNIVYTNSDQISLVTRFTDLEDASHFLSNIRQLPFVAHGMLHSIAKESSSSNHRSTYETEEEDEQVEQQVENVYISTFSITLNKEKGELVVGGTNN